MQWIVVFDTNVLISALLSLRGNPFRCLALAKVGMIQSVTCEDILDEFQEKLQVKFLYPSQWALTAADEIRNISRLVEITNSLKVIRADPYDNKVLECAVVGGATYIITGDRRHLLPLGSYEGISIVNATQFLALVAVS